MKGKYNLLACKGRKASLQKSVQGKDQMPSQHVWNMCHQEPESFHMDTSHITPHSLKGHSALFSHKGRKSVWRPFIQIHSCVSETTSRSTISSRATLMGVLMTQRCNGRKFTCVGSNAFKSSIDGIGSYKRCLTQDSMPPAT